MTDRELLVIGAGPAGLSATLAARSLGVDVELIEANEGDGPRAGGRALFVHHETLRRLERMSPGLGTRIAGSGIVWRSTRTLYRGRLVYARRYPAAPAGALPPHTSLRQVETERFLLGACRDAGVEPVWGSRIASVWSIVDSVTVRAADGREWRARYVIAADGARSAVRASVGIAMDGDRSSDYRVVVDLADAQAAAAPPERVMHYRHPALGGRNVLLVPFAGGVQVDVQCHDPVDSEELSELDGVRRWLPDVAGSGSPDRVRWVARYPCLQRVATSFVDGYRRVLLAGEAAHLFAPLGARGMNSAIADAEAAATAVSLALRSTGRGRSRAAIAEYDRMRRQAARTNRTRVEHAMRHLRAESAWTRLAQASAARLAPYLPSCGRWLDTAPYGPCGAVTPTGGRY